MTWVAEQAARSGQEWAVGRERVQVLAWRYVTGCGIGEEPGPWLPELRVLVCNSLAVDGSKRFTATRVPPKETGAAFKRRPWMGNSDTGPQREPRTGVPYRPRSLRNRFVYCSGVLVDTELQVGEAVLWLHGVSRSSDQKWMPARPLDTA